MDTKSLARSKRAHSQHQSKKAHQSSKPKAPTVASPSEENTKKQSGKPTKGKSHQFHGPPSKLPSNWDRYGEEMESGSEDTMINSASQASDIVMPKSKGADFRHLISEARSQLQSQSTDASGSFGLFDDNLPDFNQGIRSMLSVRGNSILSWIGDDNFIVDDKSSASYEASFLSMDLHALAAQLEKVNISKRLFIEADLLPPELYAEEAKEEETHANVQAEKNIYCESEVMLSQNASNHGSFPFEGAEAVAQETTSTTVVKSRGSVISTSDGAKLINSAEDESKHSDQTNLRDLEDTVVQLNLDSVSESNERKTRAFKALDAEAELDMLLDSFGQTKLLDFSGIIDKSNNSFLVAVQDDSGSFLEGASSVHASQQPLGQGLNSSKSVDMTLSIDDTVDTLLAEASNLQNKEDSVVAQEENDTLINLPIASTQSTTKLLDDFDSWLDTI